MSEQARGGELSGLLYHGSSCSLWLPNLLNEQIFFSYVPTNVSYEWTWTLANAATIDAAAGPWLPYAPFWWPLNVSASELPMENGTIDEPWRCLIDHHKSVLIILTVNPMQKELPRTGKTQVWVQKWPETLSMRLPGRENDSPSPATLATDDKGTLCWGAQNQRTKVLWL